MAHSHHMHREHQVSHRRVSHILKGEPAGAQQHASGTAFSKVTSKTAAEAHDDRIAGSSGRKRVHKAGGGSLDNDFMSKSISDPSIKPPKSLRNPYGFGKIKNRPPVEIPQGPTVPKEKRGGSIKFARGGKVKGKHQTNIAIVVPGAKGAPPSGGMPVPGGPMAGPGGPPPAAPPMPMGGPPGMPPPMHAKGGRVIEGDSTKGNINAWGKRAAGNSYFRGGAASGVGREEKANRMKGK